MTKNMAGKYQVAFSTDTSNNFPTDYAMHEAISKQMYDKNVRELKNRKREIVEFNKTANSGQAPILDFYYLNLYGRNESQNSKEIYKLVELPSQYNNFKYELYGSFGEIDSDGKVRTYSYDTAGHMITLKV